MTATLSDLEARVAALEAQRVDYQAVLSAVNALGENQRELRTDVTDLKRVQGEHSRKLDEHSRKLDEHSGYLRSLDEGQAEIKDILVRVLDRLPEKPA